LFCLQTKLNIEVVKALFLACLKLPFLYFLVHSIQAAIETVWFIPIQLQNCKEEISESEMKSPNSRNPPKKESKVRTSSDGSSSTVSVCDLDVGVDELENNGRKEKTLPVGRFERYFK
jgi:hypothetical protein